YVHTTVIFIVLLSFLFTVYCTSPEIGSPDKMYDLLAAASRNKPVKDNAEGSYLTMSSLQGLIFGIINIVGNFGTVFVDNAYWQRAIAAKPSSTVHAYLIGGLAWFAIPFTLATTMGLSGVAVLGEVDPKDVTAGLILPLAATHLLGKAGGFAALVLAMGSQVINHSHFSVIGFGIIMGALATILNYIGVSLGYMYLLMGIISSPAVFPVAFTITWKKQSALAAIVSSVV
ncbi:25652_t:CDS:2, partial [Gigaspora rosea]